MDKGGVIVLVCRRQGLPKTRLLVASQVEHNSCPPANGCFEVNKSRRGLQVHDFSGATLERAAEFTLPELIQHRLCSTSANFFYKEL